MKPKFYVVIFLIIFFTTVNIVNAKQSEEFTNFLSDKIYNDCIKENLIIKENPLFYFKEKNVPGAVLIKGDLKYGNYNKEMLKFFLRMFSTREPFGIFVTGAKEKGLVGISPAFTINIEGEEKTIINDGRNMLICGKNTLDINGFDYYWNNEMVVLPRNNLTLFGINFISNGGITIFSFALFGFLGLSIIFVKKYYYLILNNIKIKVFNKKNKLWK